MNPGTYRTLKGSTVTISPNGKRFMVRFDWFEEDDACIDCEVDPVPVNGRLTWSCEDCGGGSAELVTVA